ncbi:hypothetical protein C7B76_16300 [filamentous cyanobacterium CCP2]|nr:hypothetical protein C7B76_16300 [filamentous cyanobacterium CCP2]
MDTLNIPLGASVECKDGSCGCSTHIIFDPIKRKACYFVVQSSELKRSDTDSDQRLIPVDYITEATSDSIHLNCTSHDLQKFEPFTESHFLKNEQTITSSDEPSHYRFLPHVVPSEIGNHLVEQELVSAGNVSIHRGEAVAATDGFVGVVEELLIHPSNHKVTHLVVRRGRLWNKKELTLPVSAIDRVDQNTVYLKLDTNEIDVLPTLPITRLYQLPKHEIGAVGMAIAVFEGLNSANEVLASLKLLNHADLEVLGIAVLENSGIGKIEVKATEVDSDTIMGSVIGATLGAVLGSILGPVTAILGAAGGGAIGAATSPAPATHLIEKLLQEQHYKVAPNHSALVVLVEEKWLNQAATILNGYTDRVYQQIVNSNAVDELLNETT